MNSRAITRTAFIVVFTAISIVSNASDLMLPWHPYGFVGLLLGTGGAVTSVAAPAERRGVRVGDTVDFRRMQPADRLSIGRVVAPGRNIRVPFTSGRVVTLTTYVQPRSLADNVTNVLEVLSSIVYIALAAVLVLLRPMPSTWAFYVFSFPFCTFAATPNTWPFPAPLFGAILIVVATALSPAAFVSFALRFPNEHPGGAAKAAERALLFAIAPAVALWSAFAALNFIFRGAISAQWTGEVITALTDGMFATGIVILLFRYATADAVSRNRLRWVVAAFALAFVPFLLLTFFLVVGESSLVGLIPTSAALINLCQMWEIIAPLALAYTVLKHRLFDVRFIVSRAFVYTVITTLAVGMLALVDWAFGRWLAESKFALVAELAMALLIGVAITSAHRRLDRFLTSVIFRAQTLALQALRRFAQEADLVADPDRLLSQTYEALKVRVESQYIALYTHDGASFALTTPRSNSIPPLLPGDDFAVLRLRRWSESFECDEPNHPLRGALFVPMVARAQIVGFIVCGPKRDHTHYLPEEIETLSTLAHRVGNAYAWLTMRPDVAYSTPLPQSSPGTTEAT